jgi:hypothetical protein
VNERLHAGVLGCASYVAEIVRAVVGDYVFDIISPMKEFRTTVSVTGTDQVLDISGILDQIVRRAHKNAISRELNTGSDDSLAVKMADSRPTLFSESSRKIHHPKLLIKFICSVKCIQKRK